MVAGYNLYAPMFQGVGGTLSIQDLKLTGVAGEGEENILLMDETGNCTGDSLQWFSKEVTGEDEDGWFGAEGWAMDEIKEGQGFYIQVGKDCTMTCAGQVKFGQYSKELVGGYNLVGNCTPVAVNIQDFKLVGVAGEGEENILLMDETGNCTGDSYQWFSKDVTGEENDGWFGADGWATDELPAGQGIYLQVGSDCKMTLPAVLTK